VLQIIETGAVAAMIHFAMVAINKQMQQPYIPVTATT